MRRYILILLSLALLLSCTEKGSDDVLNIAISSEPPTLDAMVNTSLISRIVAVGNIYEKLFVLDSDGNIRTELAKGYELADGGKRLTIEIRENVPFHDGTIMEVDDVVASLNRWIDRYSVADTYLHGARFEKESENTIKIESTSTLAMFVYLMASSPQSAIITEKRIIDGTGDGELISTYIGTGPYMLDKWNSGDSIELARFDGYKGYSSSSNGIWGEKKANIERLSYKIVKDSVTRRLALQSGQYDFINDVMSEDRPFFENDENIYMIEGGESGSIALVFNKKEGIGSDIDFRKAISLAFDYDSLMKACYGRYGYSTHSDYMEKEQVLWSVEDDNEYKGQDIEKAKEYLARSSYAGERIRILTANLSNLDRIAIAMKSELGGIGIDSEIISVDWASMIERRKDPSSYDIYISAFSRVVMPQMKSYLSPAFPGWIDEGDYGIGLLNKMNNASDIESASILWNEAQHYFWNSVPAIIPGHYSTVYAARDNINGIISQDGFYFWNATKESL